MYSKKLLLALCTILVLPSYAQNDEDSLTFSKHEPVNITAQRQTFDIKNSQIIFSNHVIITQGDAKLWANKVYFKRENSPTSSNSSTPNNEYLKAFGNPVIFKKQLPNKKIIDGTGEVLRYDLQDEVITLEKGKQIPVVHVTQDDLELTSDKVIFNRQQGRSTKRTKQGDYLQAYGKPVKFNKALANKKTIYGEGETLRYDLHRQVVTLEGGAKISQKGNYLKGKKIIYDIKTENLSATGDRENQVKTIFVPEFKSEFNLN